MNDIIVIVWEHVLKIFLLIALWFVLVLAGQCPKENCFLFKVHPSDIDLLPEVFQDSQGWPGWSPWWTTARGRWGTSPPSPSSSCPPGGDPLSGEPALRGGWKEGGRLDGGFSQCWALSSNINIEMMVMTLMIILLVNYINYIIIIIMMNLYDFAGGWVRP